MFKLFDEIYALNYFTRGYLSDFLSLSDQVEWRIYDDMIAINHPEAPDFWYGNRLDLNFCPQDDIDVLGLARKWDDRVAPFAPNAKKRVIIWESPTLIDYPENELAEIECEAILKYNANKAQKAPIDHRIHKLEADQLPQLVDLYLRDAGEEQRGHYEWRMRQWQDILKSGNGHYFAIKDDQKIVATAGLIHHQGIFRYASVATHSDYRKQGMATALIAHIRDYALSMKAKEIYIHADLGASAQKIYEKAGFEIDSYMYGYDMDR